jgi:asparagine synthase (glutamine-hydrolysing)
LAEVSLLEPSLEVRPRPYWSFPVNRFEGTEEEAKEQLRDLFLDATRIHSRSDVPVGTCLSGGIDSSSIVCSSEILRKQHKIPSYSHSAFGYCAADESYSEIGYMQAVVNATGVQMHFIEIEPAEFIARLPSIIRAQDEPFGSASIAAQWFVFQRAKQEGMTVMLDGQGADEIFGGYHYYYNTLAQKYLSGFHVINFLRLRAAYEREIGTFPISLRTAIASLMPTDMRRVLRVLEAKKMPTVWSKSASVTLSPAMLNQYLAMLRREKRARLSLNEALREDVKSLSLPSLLRFEDRNSMGHSIEARVPFLDHRLVEFAFTLPDEWKIQGLTTKYILRKAMDGILPEAIRIRKDKIGFKAAPSLTFNFARKHKSSVLENRTEYERQWFKAAGVENMMNSADRSVEAEFMLWRIINTKLWVRQFWSDAEELV